MLAWAAQGARELDWIIAGRQLAGRGRSGRAWASESGNLHATSLVKLRDGDPPAPSLALVAAVAAHSTVTNLIRNFDRVQIKWPNDIMVDGAKIAGILLERQANVVAVGFGINLAHSPSGLGRPVTSMREQVGYTAEPAWVVETWLASRLHNFLQRWRTPFLGGFPALRETWLRGAHPIGTAISVRQANGATLDGLFDGLAEDGALRLRLADGSVHVMHAGDVFLL
jgi:BirA family biotin operon repressor/biotin-[acetyl-CoA-carboxylase] ligase